MCCTIKWVCSGSDKTRNLHIDPHPYFFSLTSSTSLSWTPHYFTQLSMGHLSFLLLDPSSLSYFILPSLPPHGTPWLHCVLILYHTDYPSIFPRLFTSIHPLYPHLIIIPPHLPLPHPIHSPLEPSVSSSSQDLTYNSPSFPHPSIHPTTKLNGMLVSPSPFFFFNHSPPSLFNPLFFPSLCPRPSIFTSLSLLYFYLILIF